MKSIEITTKSAEETKKAGLALAKSLEAEIPKENALVFALEGDLGAGKTTFIQGLAEGLGVKENVLSPTFVILKEFSVFLKNYKYFYHIDAYRLKNSEELLELGFEDLINNPENIIVIEWGDKVADILPREVRWIRFGNLEENKREIKISNCSNF